MASRKLEAVRREADRQFTLRNGTKAAALALRWRSIAEQMSERITALDRLRRIAEDARRAWKVAGVPIPRAGVYDRQVRLYPTDPLAQSHFPLDTRYPMEGSTFDQYQTLDNQIRVRLFVNAADHRDLALHAGESLSISIPGTNRAF